MIKLVVSDMDGTLLGRLSEISEKNVAAIHKLEEHGIEFAIASGRDYASVKPLMDRYGITCEAILGNGSQYVDRDGRILMDCYMKKEDFLSAVHLMEERGHNYMIFTTKGFYTGCDPQAAREAFILRGIRRFGRKREDFEPGRPHGGMPCNYLVKVDDFDEFVTRDLDIIKIESFAMEVPAVAATKELLKDLKGIAYLSSFDDNIEVTDKDAQKGLILEKVAAMKGLKKDEIAVLGDGMNDLSMFTCFPDWSYAPANADPEIKKLAHQVVASNLEDGFAEAVEEILKAAD